MSIDCYTCTETTREPRPPRESIWTEAGWRVAHDFNTSLPGWLVVVPTRHVEALDELTQEEAEVLGRVLRDASVAIKAVTACRKTYVMLFAEAEGFAHLHVHVVPRSDDIPADRRGPAVFGYAHGTGLTEDERDDLAQQLRAAWPQTSVMSETASATNGDVEH